MDLDELQSVQSRERQTDSLQQLRDSFYQEAGAFIEQLREERERAAERADDPWNSPEVGRLSDDIETADQTVEAIYERRVGKIVKMASLAAADMPTEDGGLTTEEQRLFDSLVRAIEGNRQQVMAVLDGEDPPTDPDGTTAADPGPAGSTEAPPTDSSPADRPAEPSRSAADDGPADPETAPGPATDPGPEGVDAADLMGGGTDTDTDASATPGDDASAVEQTPEPDGGADPIADVDPADRSEPDRDVPPAGDLGGDDGTDEDRERPPERSDGGQSGDDGSELPSIDRATVRITDDVGEILGVDQRAYDLGTDDVVTLPEQNVSPLVERDAAERLD